ncbi:hypothetical protein ACV07N_12315 [Roseivirga echinicomitans]
MAYSEFEADLLPEELKKAKLNLIGVFVFMLIFFAFIKFFFWDNLFSDMEDIIPIIIFGVFILLFLALLFYIMRGFVLDFIKKKKFILTGTITDKQIDITTSSSSSGGGRSGTGGSGTTTKRSYYLYFDDKKKLSVDFGIYNKMSVGSEVEIHYSKYSQSIFQNRVITEAKFSEDKIKAIVPELDRDNNFVPKQRELQMTREDFDLIKKKRNTEVRSRLIVALILGWVVIGPMFSGLWLLPILLFPFAIWWFIVIRKMVKYILDYRKEVNSGIKIVYSELVIDKFRQTGNTSGFLIQTNSQMLNVHQESYDKVNIGDLIMVYQGKSSGWIFGFMTSNNKLYEVRGGVKPKKK